MEPTAVGTEQPTCVVHGMKGLVRDSGVRRVAVSFDEDRRAERAHLWGVDLGEVMKQVSASCTPGTNWTDR